MSIGEQVRRRKVSTPSNLSKKREYQVKSFRPTHANYTDATGAGWCRYCCNCIVLHRRIIQHGVNGVYLAVLLCSLDSLRRAPMLDMFIMRCSGLLPCIAVCCLCLLLT